MGFKRLVMTCYSFRNASIFSKILMFYYTIKKFDILDHFKNEMS